MGSRFMRPLSPTITLERGVDFEAELGPGYREAATIVKHYLCGGRILKVSWEMIGSEVRCRLAEIDGEKVGIASERWVSVDQVRSVLDQKELLCATIKKAGITKVADIREISEDVYLKIAGLNELANLVR